MANSVFDNALAAINQATAAVEAEIGRLSGVHQQTEALRVQQRDLQNIVNELAAKVPGAKRVVEDAEKQAEAIRESGRKEKARIIANADHQASMIVESANKTADQIISDAHAEIADEARTIEDLKEQVLAEQGKLKQITTQIAAANSQFAVMRRKYAEAFAAFD